ncbi:MAG: DUF2111 domain-containing protein [Methanobacteriaceae archaeon]
MNINSSSTGEDIVELALAIHELVNRLPLTMRTKTQLGVRIEEGEVIDYNYTGPTLELVLKEGEISHQVPKTGPYQGTPVVVVPIHEENEVIAAVGVVDITQGIYSDIMEITKRPEDFKKNKGV